MDDDLKLLIEKSAAETRRHFDVSTEEVKRELQLLAETVLHGNQRVEAINDNLVEKIERSAAETQALIKFSYAELDRRVN